MRRQFIGRQVPPDTRIIKLLKASFSHSVTSPITPYLRDMCRQYFTPPARKRIGQPGGSFPAGYLHPPPSTPMLQAADLPCIAKSPRLMHDTTPNSSRNDLTARQKNLK